MNEIRKPPIDYLEFNFFSAWGYNVETALDNLDSELKRCAHIVGNIEAIEETVREVITNVYIEAFRDGNEFRRWLDDPSI